MPVWYAKTKVWSVGQSMRVGRELLHSSGHQAPTILPPRRDATWEPLSCVVFLPPREYGGEI
jgi:hypothetical protein